MNKIFRGDIYWANLNPTMGSEISKTRPVLIVSNNVNNEFSSTITILPITSATEKIYPFEVLLSKGDGNLINESKVKANQIRTIDKNRPGIKIGEITSTKLLEINNAIMIHLSL